MKRISQKKKKLIFLLTIIFLIVLIPILLIKTINKKTVNLVLQNAPRKSDYLYQNISKGFAVYLGNRSSQQTPEVKMAVDNSSIDFKPEGSLSDQAKLVKQDAKSIIYKNISPGVDLRYSLTKVSFTKIFLQGSTFAIL